VQTITLVDTTPPDIDCPPDVELVCGDSTDPSVTGTATATDACGVVTIEFCDIQDGICPALITRQWTATDECGNSVTCEQQIKVCMNCSFSQGFYKTHFELWPTFLTLPGHLEDGMFILGNDILAPEDALDVLWTPPVLGDATLILAHQYIAAVLNAAKQCSDVNAVVLNTLEAANTWFEANPLLSKPPPSANRNEGLALSETLDDYNNGLLTDGPPSCDAEDDGEETIIPGRFDDCSAEEADVDEDNVGDVGVIDPATWTWFFMGSERGFVQQQFGYPGVAPVTEDFDGDGAWDMGVFDDSAGLWHLLKSSEGYEATTFGFPGVSAVAEDYDADGVGDIAVFDPSTGNWYLMRSSEGFTVQQFGFPGVLPVPADYDGDGRSDIAVFHPPSGTWYLSRSRTGFKTLQFGYAGVTPVPRDYDGDGISDVAVFEHQTGNWHLLMSRDGYEVRQFGFPGVVPVPNDYDGDGSCDLAVFDSSSGAWYLFRSAFGFTTFNFGFPGVMPVHGPAR